MKLSAMVLVAAICIISTASASVFVYGSNYDYSQVTLENGSYVHQGENITQGNYYDLSGVYGFSGVLGHWKDEDDAGYTYPDNIVELKHPRWVYIDPSIFVAGTWHQIDMYEDDSEYYDTKDGKYYRHSVSFGNGNSLAFHVVTAEAVKETARKNNLSLNITEDTGDPLVYNASIYVFNGNESIEIPVTYVSNITAIPSLLPIEQLSDVKTIVIPTTIVEQPTKAAAPVVVTQRTPIPIILAIVSLLGVIVWRRS